MLVMSHHYDLIAVGGGSGGLAVVKQAARHGAKAALVENGRLGGTCVNVGCVPKKIMWHAASLGHALTDATDYGHDVRTNGFDWAALVAKRRALIDRINHAYHNHLADSEVDLLEGRARFLDPHRIEVGGESYSADHLVIATGGEPIIPDIPGADLGITSDGFFELTEAPNQVAVVGSGYIAVELAGVLNALGSQVTLMLRGHHLLRRFDSSLREALMEAVLESGIDINSRTQAESLRRESDGTLSLICDSGRVTGGLDTVIWAVGRRPRTSELNLEATGVERDAEGFVPTDTYQNTNVAGIYALGDVTGRAALTPVAIAAGRRLADRLFGGQPDRHLDYHFIPSVIFSHPPIGTVGLTEEEARAEHGDAIKVYHTTFTPLYRSMTSHKVTTTMKLIVVGHREHILGCHIIGEGADEMLQGFAVAIRMGATKRDLDDTVAIHPTSAEELVTLR